VQDAAQTRTLCDALVRMADDELRDRSYLLSNGVAILGRITQSLSHLADECLRDRASSPDTRMVRALVVALADDTRTLDTEGWSVSEPRLRVMLARTANQASEVLAMLERMMSEPEGE
jgi:hypothetical protein